MTIPLPDPPKSEWKNTTSFSSGETNRTPREWTLSTGLVRIVLHRHIHHEPDAWLVTCREIGMTTRLLAEKDVDLAKSEALQVVRSHFQKCLDSIPKVD